MQAPGRIPCDYRVRRADYRVGQACSGSFPGSSPRRACAADWAGCHPVAAVTPSPVRCVSLGTRTTTPRPPQEFAPGDDRDFGDRLAPLGRCANGPAGLTGRHPTTGTATISRHGQPAECRMPNMGVYFPVQVQHVQKKETLVLPSDSRIHVVIDAENRKIDASGSSVNVKFSHLRSRAWTPHRGLVSFS